MKHLGHRQKINELSNMKTYTLRLLAQLTHSRGREWVNFQKGLFLKKFSNWDLFLTFDCLKGQTIYTESFRECSDGLMVWPLHCTSNVWLLWLFTKTANPQPQTVICIKSHWIYNKTNLDSFFFVWTCAWGTVIFSYYYISADGKFNKMKLFSL